jgi:hypothetical protein
VGVDGLSIDRCPNGGLRPACVPDTRARLQGSIGMDHLPGSGHRLSKSIVALDAQVTSVVSQRVPLDLQRLSCLLPYDAIESPCSLGSVHHLYASILTCNAVQ